jgi:phenylacetate-CoA ligase
MEVPVEVTAETFSDTIRGVEAVHRQLSDAIAHILGIRVKLTLVQPNTIERSMGKAKRVIDNRKS